MTSRTSKICLNMKYLPTDYSKSSLNASLLYLNSILITKFWQIKKYAYQRISLKEDQCLQQHKTLWHIYLHSLSQSCPWNQIKASSLILITIYYFVKYIYSFTCCSNSSHSHKLIQGAYISWPKCHQHVSQH